MDKIIWGKEHTLWVSNETPQDIEPLDPTKLRLKIEPWLTALFQSEHLSLLTGTGITTAVHWMATTKLPKGMSGDSFDVFAKEIAVGAKVSATNAGRGEPNIEDQIRVANEILFGIRHLSADDFATGKPTAEQLQNALNKVLKGFIFDVLTTERNTVLAVKSREALEYFLSFLISFASRSATRERLNIYTTNYDRFHEFAADMAGIRLIDRFVGSLLPVFRESRLEVDLHYNPPGIRGEPRYLEGVCRFTKLHGSLDWVYHDGYVRRVQLPFGAEAIEPYFPVSGKKMQTNSVLIYPNSTKDRDTSEYPYVDLFRDFAAGICRPNSTLVTYGYSFGDSHINRVIKDMLTIPSTHLVIIAYSDIGNRIQNFCETVRPAQVSLLVGSHFGDMKTLVDNYLPKPAIDRTTIRMADLLKSRGFIKQEADIEPEGESK